MTKAEITEQIRKKKTYLCVGLDSDVNKIPKHLLSYSDPVFEFNRQIIDATKDYCISYKINTAFYESRGAKGWECLEKTIHYIPASHFTIADAKRGDIGNTSSQYAKAFFETLNFDAVTVAPYMGEDSVKPFLEYEGKWTILLALTSNSGSKDFELIDSNGKYLFETVLEKSTTWGSAEQLMFVVGATQSAWLKKIRSQVPEYFFLVPGVGAQGGSIEDLKDAMNPDVGIIVNSSRSIIFASSGEDFAEKAGEEAKKVSRLMAESIP